MLNRKLERIHERIHEACRRAGRPTGSVTLIGATKGVPVEVIRQALSLGLTDIGENRVQEARLKQGELKVHAEYGMRNAELTSHTPHSALRTPHGVVRWHLIGHLQSNKATRAVELFDAIHSVDSLALIQELERRANKTDVFIQVNVAGEPTKFGCPPEEAATLARAVRHGSHLQLKGFMTMAPFSENPEDARPHFRKLRELRDAVNSKLETRHSKLTLSMGMSADFEVAIEEGADLVRIGTALFGDRGRGAGGVGSEKL